MDRQLTEWKQPFVVVALSIVGVSLYVLAAISTFSLSEFEESGIDPTVVIIVTSMVGLGVLALGYGSVVTLGDSVSLKLAEFVARVTRSRHIIEAIDDRLQASRLKLIQESLSLLMPALVFKLSVTLAYDIHNLHDPKTWIFHPLLHAFDVLSKTISLDPVQDFVDLLPAIVVLVAVAGVAPSMALPYFKRYKITGVNIGPFHTSILSTVTGLVVGLSALLTVVGFIFKVLWIGVSLNYYYYELYHDNISTSFNRVAVDLMKRMAIQEFRQTALIESSLPLERLSHGSRKGGSHAVFLLLLIVYVLYALSLTRSQYSCSEDNGADS